MNLSWSARPFATLTVRELHDALRLRTDVFVVEQRCAYAEVDGQDPDAIHILAHTSDGTLVACARILPPHDGGLPHVGRVVVNPEHRGKGIADTLMRFALETLATIYGSRRSALAAQAHLSNFYGKHGYVRTGDEYPWDGIPHVDMTREAD